MRQFTAVAVFVSSLIGTVASGVCDSRPSDDSSRIFANTRASVERGNFTHAIKAYEQNGTSASDTRAHFTYLAYVISAYGAAHNFPKALNVLSQAKQSEHGNDSTVAHVALGRVYLASGQTPKALRQFKTALAISRNDEAASVAAYWLALASLNQKRPAAEIHKYARRSRVALAKSGSPWAEKLRVQTFVVDSLVDSKNRVSIGVSDKSFVDAALTVQRQRQALALNM